MIDTPLHPALVNVRDAAEQALRANPEADIGFSSDDRSNPEKVALGIALRGCGMSFAMTIAKSEYDGVKLAHLLGFPDAKPVPAMAPKPVSNARRKR